MGVSVQDGQEIRELVSGTALHRLGTARRIGVFSWHGGDEASLSSACASIVGGEVGSLEAFERLLVPSDADGLRKAVEDMDAFRIEATLRDGRLLEISAACQGDPTARVVHGTVEDISHRRDELIQLVVREELCRAVADNSPAMLWMGDENGKCVFLNQAQRDFWGVDPTDLSTFDWSSTLHPDDVAKLSGPFTEAMATHTPFSVEARYRRADGHYRTLRTEARPRFGNDGNFLGMTGVNTDVSEQLAAEERTRMLMGELNHRTKNILAVVQAVARQTARTASPDDFIRAFNDRLIGLAASNDLLLRNDWAWVELKELVQAQLGHFGGQIGARLVHDGPPIRIASSAAQTLGMALHELSTNSLKYGALGVDHGQVRVQWERTTDGGHPAFSMRWVESGMKDVVPPSRKGFGHSVIVDMVASALDADVETRFDGDGFKWEMRARSDTAIAR